MKKLALILVAALFVAADGNTYAHAKFTCEVENVEGMALSLVNCKDGIKRIKPGDTVSIVKKRKKGKTMPGSN